MVLPFYKSANRDFTIVNGEVMDVLSNFNFKFDMIFADPPYFLSNGGKSISSGKIVSVDKGDWDKGKDFDEIDAFNEQWLRLCYDKLRDGGTIWVSGTFHNIFSVGRMMQKIGYKILNIVTWQKADPPRNIYDTHFQYSSEHIIWAKKGDARHILNADVIKDLNDGKMLNDVWRLPAVQMWEKTQGRHPTQKPLPLLGRIILACTNYNGWVLDPFAGSGTTGVASSLLGRRFCGIEQSDKFCDLAKKRREEIEDVFMFERYKENIYNVIDVQKMDSSIAYEDLGSYIDLPF